MAQYLLDTNVLLRAVLPTSPQHVVAAKSLAALALRRDEMFLAPQVVLEFWAVITRPANVNGYGWSVADARNETLKLLQRFPLLSETPLLFPEWHRLVIQYQVIGKRTSDARLVAIMQTSGVTNLLTFNFSHFTSFGVNAVSPDEIAAG